MCRNTATLRGLEPVATPEEIEPAARQYERKVSGVQSASAATEAAFDLALERITAATTELLAALPPRMMETAGLRCIGTRHWRLQMSPR